MNTTYLNVCVCHFTGVRLKDELSLGTSKQLVCEIRMLGNKTRFMAEE